MGGMVSVPRPSAIAPMAAYSSLVDLNAGMDHRAMPTSLPTMMRPKSVVRYLQSAPYVRARAQSWVTAHIAMLFPRAQGRTHTHTQCSSRREKGQRGHTTHHSRGVCAREFLGDVCFKRTRHGRELGGKHTRTLSPKNCCGDSPRPKASRGKKEKTKGQESRGDGGTGMGENARRWDDAHFPGDWAAHTPFHAGVVRGACGTTNRRNSKAAISRGIILLLNVCRSSMYNCTGYRVVC